MSKLPAKAHFHSGEWKGKGKPTQKKYKDQLLHAKWHWGWKNSLSRRNWKGRSRLHCLWWRQQREALTRSYMSGSLTGSFTLSTLHLKLFILMPLSFRRGCGNRSDVQSKKRSYYSALPDKLPGQSKACTSNQDMHSSFSKAFRGIKLKIWY